MNKTIITIFLLAVVSLHAGYSSRGINEYFSDGTLYYRGVSEDEAERGFLSSKVSSSSRCINLQVFDLKSGKSWKVFERDLGKDLSIVDLVFERPIKEGKQLHLRGNHFQNDSASSKVKDRIILVVYDSNKRTDTLWSANSLGKELKKVETLPDTSDWHIDVTNQKIRVFSTVKGVCIMKEYPW